MAPTLPTMTRDDQLTGTVASMATLESITTMIGPFPTPTIRARDATTTITFVYDSEAMRGSTTSLAPMPTVTDPHSPFYTLHTPPISPVICWGLVVLFVIIYITVVRWVSIGDIPDAYKPESIVVTRDWWKKTGPRASDAVRAEQALERAKAAAAASASTTTLVEKGEWPRTTHPLPRQRARIPPKRTPPRLSRRGPSWPGTRTAARR
ncbi:hypothetical protein B0H10DRAFT_1360061 [Mycena sp. CBHHK59/15]|nr:hypothetical protein B0H10DRAFT_1360061 [Mycena sp. CBHHK59/15]